MNPVTRMYLLNLMRGLKPIEKAAAGTARVSRRVDPAATEAYVRRPVSRASEAYGGRPPLEPTVPSLTKLPGFGKEELPGGGKRYFNKTQEIGPATSEVAAPEPTGKTQFNLEFDHPDDMLLGRNNSQLQATTSPRSTQFDGMDVDALEHGWSSLASTGPTPAAALPASVDAKILAKANQLGINPNYARALYRAKQQKKQVKTPATPPAQTVPPVSNTPLSTQAPSQPATGGTPDWLAAMNASGNVQPFTPNALYHPNHPTPGSMQVVLSGSPTTSSKPTGKAPKAKTTSSPNAAEPMAVNAPDPEPETPNRPGIFSRMGSGIGSAARTVGNYAPTIGGTLGALGGAGIYAANPDLFDRNQEPKQASPRFLTSFRKLATDASDFDPTGEDDNSEPLDDTGTQAQGRMQPSLAGPSVSAAFGAQGRTMAPSSTLVQGSAPGGAAMAAPPVKLAAWFKQAMLPSQSNPGLGLKLQMQKFKREGLPVVSLNRIAAPRAERQALANTMPAAYIQPEILPHLPSNLRPKPAPQGQVLVGGLDSQQFPMRDPRIAEPSLQHEHDEARYGRLNALANNNQRVISMDPFYLRHWSENKDPAMTPAFAGMSHVAHNDPRVLLNESHRIATGETSPIAAEALRKARKNTGELAALHALGIQYGVTPLPEGGRAYNRALRRWNAQVPKSFVQTPYTAEPTQVHNLVDLKLQREDQRYFGQPGYREQQLENAISLQERLPEEMRRSRGDLLASQDRAVRERMAERQIQPTTSPLDMTPEQRKVLAGLTPPPPGTAQ